MLRGQVLYRLLLATVKGLLFSYHSLPCYGKPVYLPHMCYNVYVYVQISIVIYYFAGQSFALKKANKELRLQLRVVN